MNKPRIQLSPLDHSELLKIFQQWAESLDETKFVTWTSSPIPDLLSLLKEILLVLLNIQEFRPTKVNPAIKERPEFDAQKERAMVQLDQIPLTGSTFFLPTSYDEWIRSWLTLIIQIQSNFNELSTKISSLGKGQEEVLRRARSLTSDLTHLENQIKDRKIALQLLKARKMEIEYLNNQLLKDIKHVVDGNFKDHIRDLQRQIANCQNKIGFLRRKIGGQ